jgi:hypothetical protein
MMERSTLRLYCRCSVRKVRSSSLRAIASCSSRPRSRRRPQENSDGFTRYNFSAQVSNFSLADTYLVAFRQAVIQVRGTRWRTAGREQRSSFW